MYSRIKLLRRNGERKHDREIAADVGLVGHVTICTVVNYQVAKIHAAGDDGARAPIVPELFRVRCVTMHGARMLFQGYERLGNQMDEDAPVQKQEWSIEIMVDQPERILPPTTRL